MLVNQWLNSIDSDNTRKMYHTAYLQFFDWAGVAHDIVTPRMAMRWASSLRAAGLAERTINTKLSALNHFYRFFIVAIEDWDRVNPFSADRVTRARVKHNRALFPSVEQMTAMLKSINLKCPSGARDYALIYLYLVTCRRSSEILNLRWGDIHPLGGGEYYFIYRNKGGVQKEAVLNAHNYAALKRYLVAADRWPLTQDTYLFTALRADLAERLPHIEAGTIDPNKPLHNSFVNRMLKKYARRAGVPEELAHVHALRHIGARGRVLQMRGNGGVDYMEIMKLLGHTSLRTTQIYVQDAISVPTDPGAEQAAQAWGV